MGTTGRPVHGDHSEDELMIHPDLDLAALVAPECRNYFRRYALATLTHRWEEYRPHAPDLAPHTGGQGGGSEGWSVIQSTLINVFPLSTSTP